MDWTTNDIDDRSDTPPAPRTIFTDLRDPPPSIVIAMALAKLEDTLPSQTNFTLANEIDPDALDDLVTDDTYDVKVTFTVGDYFIVAQSNGRVQIRDIEE